MKKLVRDNSNIQSTEYKDASFNNLVLDNMCSTLNEIKSCTQTEDVILNLANILELYNTYLMVENIKSQDVLNKASTLRSEQGAYSKKLIIKE